MPTILAEQTDIPLPQGTYSRIKFNHTTQFARIVITVTASNAMDDFDIYGAWQDEPSITSYNYKRNTFDNPEIMVIWDLMVGELNIAIYAYHSTGTVTIKMEGYTVYEMAYVDTLKQFIAPFIDGMNSDIGDVNGNIDTVDNTVNTDLSGLSDDINDSLNALGVDIGNNISGLQNTVINTNRDLSDTIINELSETAGTINAGTISSGLIVKFGLDEISGTIHNSMLNMELDIKNSIDDTTRAIRDITPDAIVLQLRDVSENIKAISHGIIDDILLSVFNKVE
jgi:hypothetical protein